MGRYKIIDDNVRVPLTNLQNKKSCGTRLLAVPIPNEQRHSGSPENDTAPPENDDATKRFKLQNMIIISTIYVHITI